MSMLSKPPKFLVPITKCLSFAEDNCFKAALTSLKEFGVHLGDVLDENRRQGAPKMDTVFFHQDRFEVLVDARGFRPEDVECRVSPYSVELVAKKLEESGSGSRSSGLARNYQLPKPVVPTRSICCFSSEGVVLVSAPWEAAPPRGA